MSSNDVRRNVGGHESIAYISPRSETPNQVHIALRRMAELVLEAGVGCKDACCGYNCSARHYFHDYHRMRNLKESHFCENNACTWLRTTWAHARHNRREAVEYIRRSSPQKDNKRNCVQGRLCHSLTRQVSLANPCETELNRN